MTTRLFFPALLLVSLACKAPEDAVPAKPAGPFVPTLSLRPLAVSLARGASQAFQAEINYPEGMRYLRQPVAWRVVEDGGGTISPGGLYTAPATPGVYRVRVTREDFPDISATATVTVK